MSKGEKPDPRKPLPLPLRYTLAELAAIWDIPAQHVLQQIEAGRLRAGFRGEWDYEEFPNEEEMKHTAWMLGFGYLPAGGLTDDPSGRIPSHTVVRMDDLVVTQEAKIAFEASSVRAALSPNERNTLLKQIGALALAIAERGAKYKRGTRVNASSIAAAVSELAKEIPDGEPRGVSVDHLREAIGQGVTLLQGKDADLPQS